MKMKFLLISFTSLAALALLNAGCSSAAVEKDVEAKVAQENVNSRADLQSEAGKLIENDKELSADQKTKLLALRTDLKTKSDEMWTTSLKLKSILFKDLIQKKYDENEVELIKDRLRDLEAKRLNLIFDSVTQANKILDRQAKNHEWLSRQFFFENAAENAR